MKILRLIGGLGPEHGGPPVSSVSACIATQRAGAETTFAFPVEGEPIGALANNLASLHAEGVETKHFPYSTGWGRRGESWGVSAGLSRWIKQNYRDFDLIHCHGAWQMVTYLMARRAGSGPPIVLTPHESLTDFDVAQSSSLLTRGLKKWLRRYYQDHIDLFVMSSNLEARDSLPTGQAGSNRVTVIPHPVYDQSKHQPTQTRECASRKGLRLGYLGRLHSKKNIDLILKALSAVSDDITLSIAGDGPELETLQALSDSLGIAHRVSWQGFIDGEQKQIFLNDINVLIMPSDYECFGMAAAEAMIHGTPVITTPNTGIAEVIRAGGGGEIVSAETDTVRAVIEKLANERDKLSELGRQAAENARNSLSFAAYGGAMMRQYETLLTDRKTDRKWNAC